MSKQQPSRLLVSHVLVLIFLAACGTSGKNDPGTGDGGSGSTITAPTGVTATASDGTVTVTWQAVTGAVSYNVYYGTSSSLTTTNSAKITGITTTSKILTGLTSNTTYYFAVSVVTSGIESALSSVASATPTGSLGGGTGTPVLGSNNRSILSGTPVGSGSATVTQLRKPLVSSVGINPFGFTVETVYASRSNPTSNTAYMIVTLTNTTTNAYCFVSVENIRYDGAAPPIGSLNFGYVQGNVGLSSVVTDTCLAAGETGYVPLLELDFYSTVNSISFDVGIYASSATAIDATQAKVFATSYSLRSDTNPVVTLANQGTRAAKDLFLPWFMLMDSSGLPLIWNFSVLAGSSLAAGATTEVVVDVNYAGNAPQFLFQADFEDGTTTTSSQLPIPAQSLTQEAVGSQPEYDRGALYLRNLAHRVWAAGK